MILIWPDRAQSPESVRTLLGDLGGQSAIAVWDPDSEDGGRADLLRSLRDARERAAVRGDDPDDLCIIGFGRGAVAAAGLTRYAKRLGIGLGRVLCVAPTWDEPDPFSGSPLGDVPERVELVPDATSAAAALCAE